MGSFGGGAVGQWAVGQWGSGRVVHGVVWAGCVEWCMFAPSAVSAEKSCPCGLRRDLSSSICTQQGNGVGGRMGTVWAAGWGRCG